MNQLTSEQAEALRAIISPKHGYLVRVRERMERTGRNLDPLYKLVLAAEHAMHALSVALHYRSVGHGVGLPPNANEHPSPANGQTLPRVSP